jgi:hypothetical protein
MNIIQQITINEQVYTALATAFPKSNTRKALDRYKTALEQAIKTAISNDRYFPALKLFSISTKELMKKGKQIGPYNKKVWLQSWLEKNNLNLFKIVEKGNNISKKVSVITFTNLVTLTDIQAEIDAKYEQLNQQLEPKMAYTTNDHNEQRILLEQARELDELLCTTNENIFVTTYSEYSNCEFDIVPIDVRSLSAYIDWVSTSNYDNEKKKKYLRQAKFILAIAQYTGGEFPQPKNPSVFGRMYYHGISMQTINKEMRCACLGNSYEYDLSNAAPSWKLGYAKQFLADANITDENAVSEYFPGLYSYITAKKEFREILANEIFVGTDLEYDSFETRMKAIKQAMAAIGFGAKVRELTYKVDGVRYYGALNEIIRNKTARIQFLNHPLIVAYNDEQQILDDYIILTYKESNPDYKTNPLFRTEKQFCKSKLLAYLFQSYEKMVMDKIDETVTKNGFTVKARIHDSIVLNAKLQDELSMYDVDKVLQSINPFLKLDESKLEKWNKVIGASVSEHHNRMANEELRARQYKSMHVLPSIEIVPTMNEMVNEWFDVNEKVNKKPQLRLLKKAA